MNHALLELLADGQFHSGVELGACLGITRAAIWKSLAAFPEYGIDVESRKGKGYRLTRALELLDERRIRDALTGEVNALLGAIEIHQLIDSTNARAMELAGLPEPGPYVCVAEGQYSGRGRRGRNWVSPYGRNLCFSLVWEFQGGAVSMEGLSLAVAVSVVRAIGDLDVTGVGVKWPNDLLALPGKEKLGGILIELAGDLDSVCRAVIGVGLNIDMPAGQGAQIDRAWTDLHRISQQRPLPRNRLIGRVLTHLVETLRRFGRDGFAVFYDEWSTLDVLRDTEVRLQIGETVICGMARGINRQGALRLETSAGIEQFSGGEVSLSH